MSDVTEFVYQPAISSDFDIDHPSPELFMDNYMFFIGLIVSSSRPSKDTLDSYNNSIQAYFSWCKNQGIRPLAVGRGIVELYRAWLYNVKKYSLATVQLKITSIRIFYAAAVHKGILKNNPCDGVKTQAPHYEDQPLLFYDMSQIREIMAKAAEEQDDFVRTRNMLMIQLMAIEGLRNVEIMRANHEDIDYDTPLLKVHGKGHDGVVYPCQDTFNMIGDYLNAMDENGIKPVSDSDGTPLFIAWVNRNKGGRLTRQSIRKMINKVLEASGYKREGQSCHILRHSCGTGLYKETKDLRIVQETLRQRDPKVTARYAHVNDRVEKRYTSRLSDVVNAKKEGTVQ